MHYPCPSTIYEHPTVQENSEAVTVLFLPDVEQVTDSLLLCMCPISVNRSDGTLRGTLVGSVVSNVGSSGSTRRLNTLIVKKNEK